ncbi:MAG: tripartite tricarboxylate transporter TctB family protein [Pseudomonadota bacterium]
MMRLAFLLALLAASVFYTYIAFADLGFMSLTGRLGPGFFPRIVGIALILTIIGCLALDARRMRAAGEADGFGPHAADLGVVVGAGALMVLLFPPLGGIVTSGLFLFVTIAWLNRGRILASLAIAVILPVLMFLLFDLTLNASLPESTLGIPF